MYFLSIRQNSLELKDMVPCSPPGNGMQSTGIISYHTPDHSSTCRRSFRTQWQLIRGGVFVEIIPYDTRLNSHPVFFSITFQNSIKMFRHVYYNAISNPLSGKGGSSCSGNERQLLFRGK